MALESIGVSPEIADKPKNRKRTSMLTLYTRRFMRNRGALIGVVILALLVVFAIVGPLISPYSHTDLDFLALRTGPSAEHWFGTNGSGNDNFAQVAVGLQRSMMIAALVAIARPWSRPSSVRRPRTSADATSASCSTSSTS